MLLNSVILILQETLEAALLISVLAALSHRQGLKKKWLFYGLLSGAVLAAVYAAELQTISEWFDYVGQEVMNAALQAGITLLSAVVVCSLAGTLAARANSAKLPTRKIDRCFYLAAACIVTLAVTREGAEIFVFLSGLLQQRDKMEAVLVGSGLGLGIGLSIGFLSFYALAGLSAPHNLRVSVALLALFAGNMLSQAVMQLIQADWISDGQAVWDSSGWLPEHSIIGQLLYALVGYEATPSAWFVASYLLGLAWVLTTAFVSFRYWRSRS